MSDWLGLGTAITGFTYDLTTAVGQVRILLGDTTAGSGPKPDGANFTDTEIEHFLTLAGADVTLAVAQACSVLATMWSNVADLTVGPRSEKLSQIADRYAARAVALGGGAVALQTGRISLGFQAQWSDTEWATE